MSPKSIRANAMKSALSGIALATLSLGTSARAQGTPPTLQLGLQNQLVAVDRLAPGSTTATAVFPVDTLGTELVLDINATIANLQTSISGPGGQTITPANVGTFGGSFSTFEGALTADDPGVSPLARPGFHYLYVFVAPAAGSYTVHFDAGAGLAEESAVLSTLISTSPLGAALFTTTDTVVLGNPVVLGYALFNGASAVGGATVTANLLSDSGESATVTLLDNGAGADTAAGDGIYSGSYVPLAAGTFGVSVVATGSTPQTGSFTRGGGTSFLAVPPSALIAGSFTDAGVDTNGNSLFDLLRVSVGLNIVNAGTYITQVTLRPTGGEPILASASGNLSVGATSVAIDFPALAFVTEGLGGPYAVERVEVTFVDPILGPVLADNANDLGNTQAYTLTQFEREAILLTGTIDDEGFDDNGNSQFDRFLVRVGVDLLDAGFYSWSYKLARASGEEIVFAADSASLSAGTQLLELEFDGLAIGQSGANGPFRITDLLIEGPGGTNLVRTEVGQTGAYTSAQFEGGSNPTAAPVIDIGAACGSEFVVTFSNELVINVQVTDADVGDDIRLSITGLPAGATITPNVLTPGNPVTATIRWKPSSVATANVTITATDSQDLSSTCTFSLRAKGENCNCRVEPGSAGEPWQLPIALLVLVALGVLARRTMRVG
jgi:MYXO-CTERM domain-containing protein